MKNRLIGITGVTGVGKDYLVAAANADNKIRTRNLGTIIGEALKMDRDAMMRTANFEEIRAAQLKAYSTVISEQPLVVTCHAIRELKSGRLGYDEEMEDIFNPQTYVFVKAPAELINERVHKRNMSGDRNSVERSAAQIDEEQCAKLELTRTLADYLCTRLIVLDNIDEAYVGNVAILRSEINMVLDTGESAR
jgi:adenylate kinase